MAFVRGAIMAILFAVVAGFGISGVILLFWPPWNSTEIVFGVVSLLIAFGAWRLHQKVGRLGEE